MIKKIVNIFILAILTAGFTGCYNEFDEPAPAKVWTAQDFTESTLISIRDFKQLFYDQYGNGANSLAKYLVIDKDYVISGKVISSDQAGNVYKSLYIYDESSQSAIELKLMVSNYVDYQMGQTIFVKAKGLAIGNYRYNLSLGTVPTSQEIADGYANGNLENSLLLNQHIFQGAQGEITENDILEVTSSTVNTLTDADLGRLIRFKGITYKQGEFDGDTYPNYLETTYPNNSTAAVYTTKYYVQEGLTPTYAYSYDNNRYYGSSWFGYSGDSSTTGNYIVRVSGYSNFSLQPLPAAGATGDILAIYNKYSAKSGGFIKYQLLLNSFSDVSF